LWGGIEFFVTVGVVVVVALLALACIVDIIGRPDMRLLPKVLWTVGILFLPIIGSVVYLIVRPKTIRVREELKDEVWGASPDSLPTSNQAAGRDPWQQL
jgi:hypothetical protein